MQLKLIEKEYIKIEDTIVVKNYHDMSLSQIASEIRRDWKKVNFAAKPYLEAMSMLDSVSDPYGADDGYTVVTYFLSNARTWKGPVAKEIKKELNRRIK